MAWVLWQAEDISLCAEFIPLDIGVLPETTSWILKYIFNSSRGPNGFPNQKKPPNRIGRLLDSTLCKKDVSPARVLN